MVYRNRGKKGRGDINWTSLKNENGLSRSEFDRYFRSESECWMVCIAQERVGLPIHPDYSSPAQFLKQGWGDRTTFQFNRSGELCGCSLTLTSTPVHRLGQICPLLDGSPP